MSDKPAQTQLKSVSGLDDFGQCLAVAYRQAIADETM
jgi:hypothetical protein